MKRNYRAEIVKRGIAGIMNRIPLVERMDSGHRAIGFLNKAYDDLVHAENLISHSILLKSHQNQVSELKSKLSEVVGILNETTKQNRARRPNS